MYDFQSALAQPTVTSTQSKWSITDWLIAQQSLYPSQIHAANSGKKGNYDLCLIWVLFMVCHKFAHCSIITLHIVNTSHVTNVIYISILCNLSS